MEYPESLAVFVRAARQDTVLIRVFVPHIQSMVTTPLLLEGVDCEPEAKAEINDWCEQHANADRLKLVAGRDWFRDSYGRLLGDLADPDTGELLTDHLIDIGLATAKPNHYAELVREMLTTEGPET